MKINPELFVIPNDKDFILYLPLNGRILKANSGLINKLQKFERGEKIDLDPKIKSQLIDFKVLVEENFNIPNLDDSFWQYKPSKLTLMPTFDCNLRCVYCYSEAGKNKSQLMDFEVALSGVDLIVENAKDKGLKETRLSFHGGGEPLLHSNMTFIKEVVNYFSSQSLKQGLMPKVSSATNGVINMSDLEWIVNNFDRLNISLDGPKDIQDKQRPKKSGKGSFDKVMKSIEYLERKNFDYGIRSTITDESVKRMSEIVRFFHSISSAKEFHLEPLFECGRCNQTNFRAPSSQDFFRYALEAKEVAKKLGVNIYYSGSNLEEIDYRFCGAAGSNFFITPQGYVTTCLEVSRPEDYRFDVFIIGNYDRNSGKIIINSDKVAKLRQRTVDKIKGCDDCFAKYNCSGDCLAKVYSQTGDLNCVDKNPRCDLNRNLLLEEITDKLDNRMT